MKLFREQTFCWRFKSRSSHKDVSTCKSLDYHDKGRFYAFALSNLLMSLYKWGCDAKARYADWVWGALDICSGTRIPRQNLSFWEFSTLPNFICVIILINCTFQIDLHSFCLHLARTSTWRINSQFLNHVRIMKCAQQIVCLGYPRTSNPSNKSI